MGYEKDVCPLMSIGKSEFVNCTDMCAWFDTTEKECALSRINGNTKQLEEIKDKIDCLSMSIEQLDISLKMNK